MHIRETLSPQEFEHALRAKGAYYHIHHPYHIAMHNGEASREQIRLGGEPVLLPDDDPTERRGNYGELPGSAHASQMGAADPRSRRQQRS